MDIDTGLTFSKKVSNIKEKYKRHGTQQNSSLNVSKMAELFRDSE
jgi:hypothetical protein